MPIDDRMRAQHQLILDHFEHAATYPAADRWADVDDIDYLYREYAILARHSDADRVAAALEQIFGETGLSAEEARQIRRHEVTSGIVRLTVPGTPTLVPDLIARTRRDARARGGTTRSPRLRVPAIPAPPAEPIEVPLGTRDPVPPPGLSAGHRPIPWPGIDGNGVSVEHRGHRADAERRHGSSVARRSARREGEPLRRSTPAAAR